MVPVFSPPTSPFSAGLQESLVFLFRSNSGSRLMICLVPVLIRRRAPGRGSFTLDFLALFLSKESFHHL